MTTTTPGTPTSARLSAGQTIGLAIAGAALATFAVIALILFLDRPPASPQLTLLGTNDTLHILAEGAGGGRVLIGGGASGSELPALLGRQFVPFRSGLDLVIVVDRRDLLGATELVRRGQSRAVLTVGLEGDRSAAPALAALRDLCGQRNIPIRSLAAPERISLGHDGGLTIDLFPASDADLPPRLRIGAGSFSAAIIVGELPPAPALAAIVPRGSQERYRAALAGQPRLLIAPTVPTDSPIERSLQIVPGQRATFVIDGPSLRLRGGTLTPLDTARTAR